jgi:DNA-directed RNA polymerase alpha subunit
MSELTIPKLSLAIGMIHGQLSELLNNIKTVPLTNLQIYNSLLDIVKASSLHVHELYYKDNQKDPQQEETPHELILKKNLVDIAWIDQSVEKRLLSSLKAENIKTVVEVLKHTKTFYKAVPNMGPKSCRCLFDTFEVLGYPIVN